MTCPRCKQFVNDVLTFKSLIFNHVDNVNTLNTILSSQPLASPCRQAAQAALSFRRKLREPLGQFVAVKTLCSHGFLLLKMRRSQVERPKSLQKRTKGTKEKQCEDRV